MPFKKLTELYFDNKVKVVPFGAMSFFSYLGQLEHLLTTPGLIDLNETDILNTINGAKSLTLFGIEQTGEDKIEKINKCLLDSLLESLSSKVSGAFFHVIGGPEMTLSDVNSVAETIYNFLDPDAGIVFGTAVDREKPDSIKILLLLVEK